MLDNRELEQLTPNNKHFNKDGILITDELSDQELDQLIKSVEDEGLLKAPQYLKDNILSLIEQEDKTQTSNQVKATSIKTISNKTMSNKTISNKTTTVKMPSVTTIPTKSSRSKNLQLTLYSMKVALAAAAAIALVILIPVADDGTPLDKQNGYEQQMEYEQMQKSLPTNYEQEANQEDLNTKSIYNATNSICSKLLEKTNQIFK